MPTIEQARAWYTGADVVHDFDHVLRVYAMAQRLSESENADWEIVAAAVLLHDSVGATPGSQARTEHHLASAEFAAQVLTKEGWPEERIRAVQHCIRAHRYRDDREPPATIEAQVLFDADKLDVLGAVGIARAVAYATLAGEPVYAQPSQRFLTTGQKEPGESHSCYHEYLFKLSKIKERLFTTTGCALAVERDAYIAAYFDRLKNEWRGES
ncbi:MAG: HD domain-containing protein [Anaerolineaceae bacterium]|nr:HD domain-containing protein [Anaerolineaceae bacterium]